MSKIKCSVLNIHPVVLIWFVHFVCSFKGHQLQLKEKKKYLDVYYCLEHLMLQRSVCSSNFVSSMRTMDVHIV